MGSVYLTQLADWCRAEGLSVVEVDGWQHRARSSGGYESGRPWCVMWHHTASTTTPANDAAYICHNSPDAPISNLLLARDGEVWVCAGGATNTNGKGGPVGFSKGNVPKDSMNSYAVSIEAANNGVGEAWPQAQMDAYFLLSNMLCRRLGLNPTDVCTHQFYAPDRKIDPATASAVQGPWRPTSATSSGTWSQDDVEGEAAQRAGADVPEPPLPGPDPGPTQPAPPIGEDDKSMVVALDENGTAWIGDGMTRYTPNEDDFNVKVLLAKDDCFRLVNTEGGRVNGWGDVRDVGANVIEALGRRV
jgi:hypothetical protein